MTQIAQHNKQRATGGRLTKGIIPPRSTTLPHRRPIKDRFINFPRRDLMTRNVRHIALRIARVIPL